MLLLECIICI